MPPSDKSRQQAPNSFWDWLDPTSRGLGYTSEAALARALEISPTTVMRWRQGSKPNIRQLLTVSRVFGVKLEPLLVLAGLVPPEAVGNTDLPESPSSVTPIERAIIEADLDEHLREVLAYYWKERRLEELNRIERLIALLKETKIPLSEERYSGDIGRIFQTSLSTQVSKVIAEWTSHRMGEQASRRRRKPFEPDAQFVTRFISRISDSVRIVEQENEYSFEVLTGGKKTLKAGPFSTLENAERAREAFLEQAGEMLKSRLP
ncbi:hypothetical protein [Streptosporangium sp. 'caverna']|uniref:hypothetical protein n=1 Tax=Streptosporangium sp. 'caverna' TaxID=2202249 RepID=UPI0013A6F966|nr:hypothetical protein [Streptosporangium sp. 'caverna']